MEAAGGAGFRGAGEGAWTATRLIVEPTVDNRTIPRAVGPPALSVDGSRHAGLFGLIKPERQPNNKKGACGALLSFEMSLRERDHTKSAPDLGQLSQRQLDGLLLNLNNLIDYDIHGTLSSAERSVCLLKNPRYKPIAS